MLKIRFGQEVIIKNGKITKSTPTGVDNFTADQKQIVQSLKPTLNNWVKSRVALVPELFDSNLLVLGKYSETAHGVTVEFKVKSVVPVS